MAWGRLGPGRVQFAVGEAAVEIHADGGPGVVTISGLQPDRPDVVDVSGPGVPDGRRVLPFRTLAPLPGPELHRFATVSDLHLGCREFGLLRTMKEKPQPDEVYTLRTARAALAEAKEWGAERLIAKGDITHGGALDEWLAFGRLVDDSGLVVDAIPGNHDGVERREIDPNDAFEKLGLDPIPDGCRWIDVPGLRIVLVDSTLLEVRRGHLDHLHDVVLEAVSTDRPVWMGMHHHLESLSFAYFYPPGIRGGQGQAFLDQIVARNPRAFLSSGHTHRNRRRDHGPVVLTEVGSPEDYPGVWAAYTVHETGIRQVVRRLEDPRVVPWIEYSARAAGTLWGRWSPGQLDARCFNHPWP